MTTSQHRRKLISIALGSCVLLLFAALATLNAFNLKFLNPSSILQIFVLTGLSTLAFLLFVAVLVLLVRNLLKLYADQRSRVLGSRLRVRMLWGAVLVSLLPIAFMFTFSYLLMNRAVDRWFSQPVTQMRDDSGRIALQLSQYTAANARSEAESIAAGMPPLPELPLPAAPSTPAGSGVDAQHVPAIEAVLRQHEITLQSGFAAVFRNGRAIASFQMPAQAGAAVELKPWLSDAAAQVAPDPSSHTNRGAAVPDRRARAATSSIEETVLSAAQRTDQPLLSFGQADYALGTAALKQGGLVVVAVPVPYGMAATIGRLNTAADTYWALFRSRRQIRSLYTLLLLMMTSLALFACSWLALHLSKQVTRPVEALADAMDLIASGDYAHRVEASATDELGDLVRSFNRMASDLESSRHALLESTVQLSAANSAVEARRGELETMLETIPNGVATLSPDRRVLLANRALSEMMDPGGQRRFLGAPIDTLIPAEIADVLDRLMRRSHRMGTASAEIELSPSAAGSLTITNLLATVALLETSTERGREHQGYVLVLENATELLRAQKQSAWKEVARRVAHEIKNPLTPIALSAEQTLRHVTRLQATLESHGIVSHSPAVITRCSETIAASVESMRSLVDQFSALAEFPTAQPRPADLNTIVENALALFAGRLQSIRVLRHLTPDLPLVLVDPEALKRALSNLIDNAAEAMQHALLRELHLSTALLPNGLIELAVADTGSGLTDEMRERLFLPYFSTKQRGTGLGLAIAAKIIQEHQGTIRAEKNRPAGARFLIELRPAVAHESDAEADPRQLASLAAAATGRNESR